MAAAMPVAVTRCHEAAPSVVLPISAGCVWQSVAVPVLRSRPFVASAKEASVLTRPGAVERSTQVSPRSEDRKSRVPATNAHTTVLDGALS